MPLPPADAVPVLEVFYSPSCVPCRLELPVVAAFSQEPGVHLRIVILDQEERARAELRAASVSLEALAETGGASPPGAVLRDAGSANGILPYARSVSPEGRVCAKWLGRLTLTRARSLLAACSAIITSPTHSPS